MILAADIGGTSARMATFEVAERRLTGHRIAYL